MLIMFYINRSNLFCQSNLIMELHKERTSKLQKKDL